MIKSRICSKLTDYTYCIKLLDHFARPEKISTTYQRENRRRLKTDAVQ